MAELPLCTDTARHDTGFRPRPEPRWAGWRSGVLALLIIAVVIGGVWRTQRFLRLDQFDQPFYLGIAYDLVHSDRFTDGYRFASPGVDGLRPEGMRFAPLYPFMLATVSAIDPGLRAGMDCLVNSLGQDLACSTAAPLMRGLQLGELCLVLWLVWWMGGVVAGSARVGWMTLGLALFTVPLLLRSVAALMTEATCLTCTTAATACAICMVRSSGGTRAQWGFAAGALLGLAALTRPAMLYLVPFSLFALGIAIACAARRADAVRGWLAFAFGSSVTIAPWVVRNTFVLGRSALTFGYDSHTLVQRIAFDTMNWREYGLAYLCWLPDGTSLGRRFVGPHGCDRFGWDEQPSSFYTLGLRHMLDQTLVASGGYEHHLGYLVREYLFRMPFTHLAVTIPLALRGAYVSHWWGFGLLWTALGWTAVCLLRPARRQASGGLSEGAFLVIALPAWFMLLFNALVAVNQVRYNLMLVPLYAVAGGLSLQALFDYWVRRRQGVGP